MQGVLLKVPLLPVALSLVAAPLGGCTIWQQLQAQTVTAGRQKMSVEKQVNDNYSQSPVKPGHQKTCIQFWALLQTSAVTLDSSRNFTALVFSLLTRANIE